MLADTRMPTTMDYSALRMCVSGAGGMRRDRWIHVRDRLGFEVRQSYGSVETGALTINMDRDLESTCDSVGKPLQGVQIEIRNKGNETTEGNIAGHVYSKSPATGRLLESSQSNRRDPNGWIAMQDLGHFDDEGRLYLDGRLQGLVNVAGRKVSTTEVEQVLLEHPNVAQVTVLPCQDAYGEEAVRAVLVLKSPCHRSDLVEHCRRSLSEYKVPRVIDVVDSLDNL
jgi:long-chain acyl-CoA synthetase